MKVKLNFKNNIGSDLNLDYFRGSNKGLSPSLNGFQLIAVPFFF
jgi:cobalt-zinc-cadmium resistance protein CzcA